MVEALVHLQNCDNLAVEQGECLTVLIPCHSEGATLGELLRRTRDALPLAEVIVIDDGSADDSAAVAEGLQAELDLIVLRLAVRSGKGAAVQAGLQQARRSWVVIQDADLEYDPRDLRRLASTAHANPQAAVYGSRYLQQGKAAGGALAPYLGVKFLGIIVKLLYGSSLSDTHTCYKMLPTALMRRLALQSTGFELCAEITGKLLNERIRIIEVPIAYLPRSVAAGKKIRARDFFKAIGTYWRCRFVATGGSPVVFSSNRTGEPPGRHGYGLLRAHSLSDRCPLGGGWGNEISPLAGSGAHPLADTPTLGHIYHRLGRIHPGLLRLEFSPLASYSPRLC
ncbi:MAG: glycosyltransferase family 2 protein, partial [Bythopirellula sp.]|nr:glycosyltransferase family 2 protein [Bythopirellula sp.]